MQIPTFDGTWPTFPATVSTTQRLQPPRTGRPPRSKAKRKAQRQARRATRR